MRGLYSQIIASSYQSSAGPSIPIITTGLQLYLDASMTASYPGSGTTWTDLSPNGFSITLNGPTYVNSGGVKYLDFDGVNDYGVSTTTTNALNMSTNGISIGFWGRYGTTPSYLDSILSNDYAGAGSVIAYGLDNRSTGGTGQGFGSGVFVSGQNSAFRPINRTISLNNWKYWCMVVDVTSSTSATLRLYENGVQVGTASISVTTSGGWNFFSTQTANINIGALNVSTGFQRYLDANVGAIHHYNRELSATEVLNNFNSTKADYGL